MKVTKNDIDALNSTLIISIEKKDYSDKVSTVLKNHRRQAVIPGFRKGNVPMGLIKKQYGTSVLVEEINKLVSESLSKFFTDTENKVLGEPLPNEKEQKQILWGEQDDYEFVYDVAFAPTFEAKLTKRDKLNFYTVKVEKDDIKNQIDAYKRRFGHYEDIELTSDIDLVKGEVVELDGKKVKEGGLSALDASILISMVKDEKQKELFVDKKIGDKIIFNPLKAFDNNTHEFGGMLKVDQKVVVGNESNFRFTVKAINRWVDGEENQGFYDNVFGKDSVKNAEEFKEKIIEDIKSAYVAQSNHKFGIDAKKKLIEKISFDIPSEFLKRWLRVTNEKEKLSDEQIENDFPNFEEDLRWQLIKEQIALDNKIEVKEEDILDAAKSFTLAQFQQYYGGITIPDEQLESYAKEMMAKQDERRRFFESKLEEKTLDVVKEAVKLEEKEIKTSEFTKLFE